MARSTVSLILTVLLLISCTGGTVQYQFRTISGNDGWERTDTLTYDIPEIQKTRNYGMHIQIRVGTQFPYRTIWIARELELDNPHMLKCDTVRIDMSDSPDQMDATGVTILTVDREVSPIHLKKGQKGRLRLMHLMRQESLPMIHEIGIKLVQ